MCPSAHFTNNSVLVALRQRLETLGLCDAQLYRTRDFRRGHAKDIQMRGGTLYEILSAGEWRSPSVSKYLDLMELELGSVVEAHLAESSGEDEGI